MACVLRGCFVVVAVFVYFGFRYFNPSDWVDVTFHDLPPARSDYHLVASRGSAGPEIMSGYSSKVFPGEVPFQYEAARDFGSFSRGGTLTRAICWIDGDRYGFLTCMEDGRWRIWWLRPEEIRKPLMFRHLVGGGRATVRMPGQERSEIVSDDVVKHLDPLMKRRNRR